MAKNKKRKGTGVFIACLIVGVLLALGCRFVVFEPVRITTGAMSPDYTEGDIVIINKLTLWQNFDIQRDDIVYASFGSSCKLIRRVVGVAGDLIDVRKDGTYLVYQTEEGSKRIYLGKECAGLVHGTLPEGAYLLLSDDTEAGGLDSRQLGLVYRTGILGLPYKTVIDK